MACVICHRPNGFGVPIYAYRTIYGHADCIDVAYDAALKQFIRGIARLTAKYYVTHNLQPPKEWMERKDAAPQGSTSPRYMMPEYIIHTEIPVGRSGRGKMPVSLD